MPSPNLSLETDLSAQGVRCTPVRLILPDQLDEKTWAAIGRKLSRAAQVIAWWLGDWAAFGLDHFENGRIKYHVLKEFAQANNLNYQTLANYAWVARNVTFSRRRENLDWSKHAEVAALAPQAQKQWLARAEEDNLPVAALRQQIRLSQSDQNALTSDGPAMENPRKPIDQLLAWIEKHPDPANDPENFWTEDRRATWKDWLRPVLAFAAQL
jgi:hypothetical protein